MPKETSSTVLLTLSGDRAESMRWARSLTPGATVAAVDKRELKWESKREALARVRALRPATFAIFCSDLRAQSAVALMELFGLLAGARRVVLGDALGKTKDRGRVAIIALELPRLLVELAIGYGLLVPCTVILAVTLQVAVALRRAGGASLRRRPAAGRHELRILYLRATIGATLEGGMATHVAGFGRAIVELGHRIDFIVSGAVPSLPPGTSDRVTSRSVAPSAVITASRAVFELWNNLRFTAAAAWQVLRPAFVRGRTAFIYQRHSRFNASGVVLSLITGLPLFLEFNGSEVWVSRRWDPVGLLWLLGRLERLSLLAADRVFVVSEVQKRALEHDGLDGAKLVVNPNGVEPEVFRPGLRGADLRRQLRIDGKVAIGFLGTFGPWHGAPVLARAAIALPEAANCYFLFVGDGEERALTEGIVAEAPNRPAAHFAGRVAHDQVPDYLDACDVLVAPQVEAPDGTEFFGSPTKLFEYLAMAKPVIASRLGQIAEVIEDGRNGLLVTPGNAADLGRAIERLAADPDLRKTLGTNGRETVEREYTWRANASRVIREYTAGWDRTSAEE